jgi:hypothetical protein
MGTPPPPDKVGKTVKTKHPDGKTHRHRIMDEIRVYQTGNKRKLIYLQKIKLENGSEQLRLGYYIIGKKGRYARTLGLGAIRCVPTCS